MKRLYIEVSTNNRFHVSGGICGPDVWVFHTLKELMDFLSEYYGDYGDYVEEE